MYFAESRTKKEPQRFVGALNYDRTPGSSEMAHPLHEILEKETKFKLAEVHREVFERLKARWANDLGRFTPDLKKEFELDTGASNIESGAFLHQCGKPRKLW